MKRFHPLLLILIVLSCWPNVASAQNVTFPDANLAAAVRKALELSPGADIPQTTLQTLRYFAAYKRFGSGPTLVSGVVINGGSSRQTVWNHPMQLNKITDLTGLEQATALRTLDLRWNQISDISSLASLTQLQVLAVRSNSITDFSVVANFTNLRSLNIQSNPISSISFLSNSPQLTDLHFGNHQSVTSAFSQT